MKKRRIVSLALAIVLCIILIIPAMAESPGLSNFKKQAEYTGFTDVPDSAWYTDSVKTVCEYGLMNGTGNGKFNPNGYVTMSESVAIMSRLHYIYNGKTEDFEQSSPWFVAYDDYAAANGLDAFGFHEDFEFWRTPPTRELFVGLVSKSIPASEFQAINDICTQEPTGDDFTDRLFQLFNAGVITGKSDGSGFDGGSVITRAEVATILTRMIDKSSRVLGRPVYTTSRQDVIDWVYDVHSPGDMYYGGENELWTWHSYDNVTACINGIQYDVVLNGEIDRTQETNNFTASETNTKQKNCDYIINTNTGKFHYTWCSSVKKMAEKNKWYYTETRDSVIGMGYVPCKNCNP